MKTRNSIQYFLTALLAVLLTAGTALAQHHEGKEHAHEAHRTKMKAALGLTDEQATQMDAIHEKYRGQMKAVWEDGEMDRETRMDRLHEIHKEMKSEFDAILTDEQQAKMEDMRPPHGHGRFRRGHHGHHGHGGNHREFHKEMETLVLPYRQRFEQSLSEADKAEIARLRDALEALRPQMQEMRREKKDAWKSGEKLGDAQQERMKNLHGSRREIMEMAVAIGKNYEDELTAIHEALRPQLEGKMKEMHAKRMERSGKEMGEGKCGMEGESESFKKHCDRGEGHGRRFGHHGHERHLAKFILMDPNGNGPAEKADGSGMEAESADMDVFPNPAAGSNSIRYTVRTAGEVRIELLTTDGKLVRVLSEENKQPGTYTLDVATDDLSTGVYYYRLTDADGSKARRFSVVQ